MSEVLSVGWDILRIILVGIGIVVALCIVANIIFASILTTVRFVNSYKQASKELEEAEKPEDEGPQYNF